MRRLCTVLAILLVVAGSSYGQHESPPRSTPASGKVTSFLGYNSASSVKEREAEARALSVPSPENARRWLKTLTEEPHVAGTPADEKTAMFVRDRLQEWGWKVEIVPLQVLLNYPSRKPTLHLIEPRNEALEVDEKPVSGDKDSASTDAFGAFHGYGMSGVAKGQVVYANYGRAEDFEALEKMGVSVKDKIVLARYGGNFRGLKVLAAQKRGAAGILIFSDPADDGYAKGDTYPAGPFRPGSAIQRGSVQFLSLGPGDPSTPNGPSTKDADRLPVEFFTRPSLTDSKQLLAEIEKKTGIKRDEYFATIPSLPIGYDTASVILKELGGAGVPSSWQGGLPMAYHVGPGSAEVQFSVSMDYGVRTIWNVIATLSGSVEPDRWILVGNHRDAWVYGAVDPGSGTAATLEMCRALGEAVKTGWKPRRSIVYASWDAEEYGLVGSTEWAELNAKAIDEKAALLLNVDSAVSGRELSMGGVPSLRDLALEAAGAVLDTNTGKPLRDLWLEARHKAWAAATPLNLTDPLWDEAAGSEKSTPKLQRGFVAQMQSLGSGSDYTVFLDHLGVPALDIGFSGRYGVYHSIYDDFHWMEKHGDPEFITHAQAARLYTALIMRAAAAEVLPFRFRPYGEALRDHLDELRLNVARQARSKMPAAGAIWTTELPELSGSFSDSVSLAVAIRKFQARAAALDGKLDELSSRREPPQAVLARINDQLIRVERAFLFPRGLTGRPWFRHAVYAPGLTTGYGAWPLPAIRQAVEEKRPDRLAPEVLATSKAIGAATAALEAAEGAVQEALTSVGTE